MARATLTLPPVATLFFRKSDSSTVDFSASLPHRGSADRSVGTHAAPRGGGRQLAARRGWQLCSARLTAGQPRVQPGGGQASPSSQTQLLQLTR